MSPSRVIAGVIALLVIAVGARVIAARRSGRNPAAQADRLPPGSNPEFARLLRRGEPPDREPPAAPASARGASPSAAQLLEIVQRLRAANAGWPDILAAINPRADARIGELLQRIRGPHQFAPHVALNVIEDACRQLLVANPAAGVSDALSEALRRSDVVTQIRD